MNHLIQKAAISLLSEVSMILKREEINYIILGGWSPYLLNTTKIIHPGTRDVDILIDRNCDSEKLNNLINSFLSAGFFLSSINEFQIYKTITIGLIPFIFQVDFLIPVNGDSDQGIMLPVYLTGEFDNYYEFKPISITNFDFLFSGFVTEYPLIDSASKTMSRILTPAGCVLTKARSIGIEKRKRDSLDIFISIGSDANYTQVVLDLKELKTKNIEAFSYLNKVKEHYHTGSFYRNLLIFHSIEIRQVENRLNRFFSDIGI